MMKVNFYVLYDTQGLYLTPEEVEYTKVSMSNAVQLPIKSFMLKSIIEVVQIIPAVDKVKSTFVIPDIKQLSSNNVQ